MTKRSGASRRKKAKERAAAAATYPPWVLLEHNCVEEIEGSSSSSIADLNTVAACHTSTGSPIAAALRVAPPPEASRLCVRFPVDATVSHSVVMAADRDSILISEKQRLWRSRRPNPRPLYDDSTGLLRCGEDEIVVAELEMEIAEGSHDDPCRPWKAPELIMFLSGEWSVKRPPIISAVTTGDGNLKKVVSMWFTKMVVPLGDRMLCWSDQQHGVIFSDVFDQDPVMRYLPFPVESRYGFAVCVTAGGDSVKVVNMFPHCRCGDDDEDRWSSDEESYRCRCSIDTFTISTWMLRMDDMTWTMPPPHTMTKRSGSARQKKAKGRAAAEAVAYPPSVLLDHYCVVEEVIKGSSSSSIVADVNTLVAISG
ncbi:hypothetical protein QOZ80_9AG0671520 [Eleusine coracana subsp. coracana]|nr:hypothetical protein QOZ80_9AG0671520 [Eleusine coracana subsp. coracana]